MNPNNYVGKDFLSMPKAHHHVSRLLILVIVLLVIALAAGAYTYLTAAPKVEPVMVQTKPQGLTDAQRKSLMSQPSDAPVVSNLSDAQRLTLMNKKTAAPIAGQTITDAERQALMNTPTKTN